VTAAHRFKTCPSCGEENASSAADCSRCGADILAEPVEQRSVDKPSIEAPSVPPLRSGEKSADALRLESLANPGAVFAVRDGQTVGRSEQADVVIEDVPELDSISRVMAKFTREGDQWYVQHLATTNFISVDGEEYEGDDEVALHDGAVLGLALCQFLVSVPGAS
jgi:pSer/pThr/pTyr-binding forkhead associated (FHA) protein